jgi:DNA-binding LacI/PurR family transcriptional regulator
LEKMGRVATQMLLDLLKHPDKEADRIELPTQLIVRDSCSSPTTPGLMTSDFTLSVKKAN